MEEQNTEEGLPAEAGAEAGEGMGSGKGKSTKMIVILVVIVVLGGIYAWARKGDEPGQVNDGASVKQEAAAPLTETPAAESPAVSETPTTTSAVEDKTVVPAGAVMVTHTDAGFAPQTATIKKGTTVTFKNESESATWPASAMHPTHAVYPTTGGCIGSTFDACLGLPKGETWSFKFDIVGSWKYHDHLNPTQFGTIVVTE